MTSLDTIPTGNLIEDIDNDVMMRDTSELRPEQGPDETNPIDSFGDNPEETDTRNWITITGKIRRYKASINAKDLETSTIPKKIQLV